MVIVKLELDGFRCTVYHDMLSASEGSGLKYGAFRKRMLGKDRIVALGSVVYIKWVDEVKNRKGGKRVKKDSNNE